ncbi:hypothetical protein ACH4LN_16805 [Streptomyces albus]|uniref:hypothetical protein n=1 Tax=Streptomyces TaxID=1883 RepID=UPI00034E7A11|nr:MULTISPECIES: hypothetical protein [Streptomyces]EPD93707.1 hypothetical protein HMPREF1486_03563 [Streptomyces sp. HPH0547]QID38681.1 hypothetical protein G3260_005376 [Streptomyces albus]
MPLGYQDVMSADLSQLVDLAKAWQHMGERFGELMGAYVKHVPRALANGNWQGESFSAHQMNARSTAFEFAAAETEALAVASLLRQAHVELTRLREVVRDLVTDAEDRGYEVDSSGVATYVGSDKKRTAGNDPGHSAACVEAAQAWTDKIAKAVKAVDEADQKVKRALVRAVSDLSTDGDGIGGFNAHAESDLETAGSARPTRTKIDGWVSKGSFDATGPGADVTLSGPGYGRQGMAKAYADLFHVTAQGSLTRGEMKLSGIADANGGVRASASGGITEAGIDGTAEVSGGLRAFTEGRFESDFAGIYGRGTGFTGGEAGANVSLGADGFSAGGKAFAGGKVSAAGGAEAGGISIGATGEAWAGPGVEADLTFGEKNDDGKFHIGADLGASPIVGGKVGAEIVIDPGKVADTANDAADAVGDMAGSLKKTITGLL